MPNIPDYSDTDQWLTVAQVAKRLGVKDTKTIRNWIEAGDFPGTIRHGKRPKSPYRIPLTAVLDFEESRKVLS
jgi:excisionase family DNA binding protein